MNSQLLAFALKNHLCETEGQIFIKIGSRIHQYRQQDFYRETGPD
jgi:hypothetical protein